MENYLIAHFADGEAGAVHFEALTLAAVAAGILILPEGLLGSALAAGSTFLPLPASLDRGGGVAGCSLGTLHHLYYCSDHG